jgi:molybdenum cofactor biosynthesis enzyme MoaA
MQVFYVNVGGSESTVRPAGLLAPARLRHRPRRRGQVLHQRHQAGQGAGEQLARTDYVDVQISLDGTTAEVNDRVRAAGSFATATRALANLAEAGMRDFKVSVVATRKNVSQLDAFKVLTDRHGAQLRITQLRITRLRPSGRSADIWDSLHPTEAQQRELSWRSSPW